MTKFRVATWNLENLFPPGSSFGTPTDAVHQAKLDSLAAVILKLDPDAPAAQEIGDPEALTALVARMAARSTASGHSTDRTRGVTPACGTGPI